MKSKSESFRKASTLLLLTLGFAHALISAHANDLTTTNVEAVGSDWNTFLWRINGTGTAFAPSAGNTYQTLFNGTFIGNSNNNTRIRNPAAVGIQNFAGDSLTLNTNTELRVKTAGAILRFLGVGGNPGLILNGGMLNAADDATFSIIGNIQVASQSFIANGRNGGGGVISYGRAFNIGAQLTGAGDMVILLSSTNVPQQISSVSNSFAGQWIVQCGWLQGVGQDSLGTNNIVVDPLYTGYLAVMPLFETTNCGAVFEPVYDLNSAGSLILTNGGRMILHQNCAFSSVVIEGTPLTYGTHPYSELAANFPNNFVAGGGGSITVQSYGPLPSFSPTVSQQPTPSSINVFNKATVKIRAAFVGARPIAYQWKFTTNGVDYVNVPGATSTNLTLNNCQPTNSGYYSLWASNAVNGDYTAASSNAEVIVMGPAPALKSFPLTANQRGTVTCLANSLVTYDVYLPPGYSTNGPPLPILYTLSASGGGLVNNFQVVCSNLNIIVIGVVSSKNGASWPFIYRDFYAVPRDVQRRVLFDPTAQFVSGESGGGDEAYDFTRFWPQQISGIFAMSGWMGRVFNGFTNGVSFVLYYNDDHFMPNLLVARSTGTSDNPTQLGFLPYDGAFLTTCGANLQDWWFEGGHTYAPDPLKTIALQWLVAQHTPASPYDATNAIAQAANWRSRATNGQAEAVFRECVFTLMNQPRTWPALEAQIVMDDLMTNYNTFRTLNVSNLADGIFASEIFFQNAFAAVTNGDKQRYYSNLKAWTGVTNPNHERDGDLYALMKTNGYPAPILRATTDPVSGRVNVEIQKDAPGLEYVLQSRASVASDTVWQDIFAPFLIDTNSFWSGGLIPDPNAPQGFYRVRTTVIPATSPIWHQ
jgi:hypothetical protein